MELLNNIKDIKINNIKKLIIIFNVLFLVLSNTNVYAGKTYRNPANTWAEEIGDGYQSLKINGKELAYSKYDEYVKKTLKVAWDKIKKTEKKDDLDKKFNEIQSNLCQWKGGNSADEICADVAYMLWNAIPKLKSGKLDKNTDYTKVYLKKEALKKLKEEFNSKIVEKGKQADEDKQKIKQNETNEASVGSLPERKLGLDTDQKTASAKEKSPDEIIKDADGFLNKGTNKEIDEKSLKNTSNTVYNILLGIAIVLAIIIGACLGITFMLAGSAGKAKVKEALIPYAVGCFVAFGAFGIWKLVVTILNQT